MFHVKHFAYDRTDKYIVFVKGDMRICSNLRGCCCHEEEYAVDDSDNYSVGINGM